MRWCALCPALGAVRCRRIRVQLSDDAAAGLPLLMSGVLPTMMRFFCVSAT